MIVTVITPSNVAIFPEYIIPNIKHLVQDPEVSVRCTYAQCIVQLADTALRYLEMGQALRAHGAFNLSAEAQEYDNAHFEVCCELRWSLSLTCRTCCRFLTMQVCKSYKIKFRIISPPCSWTHRAL